LLVWDPVTAATGGQQQGHGDGSQRESWAPDICNGFHQYILWRNFSGCCLDYLGFRPLARDGRRERTGYELNTISPED
jgi:hypothetical protein